MKRGGDNSDGLNLSALEDRGCNCCCICSVVTNRHVVTLDEGANRGGLVDLVEVFCCFLDALDQVGLATGLAPEHRQPKCQTDGNCLGDEEERDVFWHHGDEAEDTGRTQRHRAQVEEAYQGGTKGGTDHAAEEGPADSKVDTEDGWLGDPEEGRGRGRACQTLDLLILHQEEDR